ncbi:MAG: ribosomal protein S18-alanine N-acetyltransferase [Lachnospiraceae bacterium]|nr:ribosomal protein S18-alanine N-acetyltransferase [Lachnospiraceae bacterium]
MQIRPMTREDCEQVAAIEAVSFSVPWSLNAFLDTVERENYRYVVAEEAGKILGYCGFCFVLDEAEIPNVCVKAEARQKGIGRRMMSALLDIAKNLGITVLFLEVRESNAPARQLYESLGFLTDGVRKKFYEQPVEDAVLMSKTL